MELTGFGTGLRRSEWLGQVPLPEVVELTGFGTGLRLSPESEPQSGGKSCGADRFWNGVKTA